MAPALAATTCTAASGPQTVPLVELFTSEGCDSCPPADRWLSAQFPVARADGGATVLAFHVDYWDRLGWKDRFATPQFTQRQYAAMRATGATFVYTPQVLVQGRDAQWQRGGASELLAAARKRAPRAEIGLEASAADAGKHSLRARVALPDGASRKNATLWLAYADSGLVSDVKAGENRGVRLAHDHVVRALLGPFAADGKAEIVANVVIPRPFEAGRAAAFVAVVQDAKTGDVLQTLSLPVCGSS